MAVGIATCPGMSEDRLPDGTIPAGTDCAWADVHLTGGDAAGQTLRVDIAPQLYRAGIADGAEVELARYDGTSPGEEVYVWVDYSRDLPLGVIGAVFAVLVVAVARLRGIAALAGLVVAYLTIVSFMLPALRAPGRARCSSRSPPPWRS